MCEIVNNASHGLKAKHKPRAKMAYVQHQPNEFVTCSQTSLSHPHKRLGDTVAGTAVGIGHVRTYVVSKTVF